MKDYKTDLKVHALTIAVATCILGSCSVVSGSDGRGGTDLDFWTALGESQRSITDEEIFALRNVTGLFEQQHGRCPKELGELREFAESNYPDKAAKIDWDRFTYMDFVPEERGGLGINYTHPKGHGYLYVPPYDESGKPIL